MGTCVLMRWTSWPRGLHAPGCLMQAAICRALHAYKLRQHNTGTHYRNPIKACSCCFTNSTGCVPKSQQPRAEVKFLGRAARARLSPARRQLGQAQLQGSDALRVGPPIDRSPFTHHAIPLLTPLAREPVSRTAHLPGLWARPGRRRAPAVIGTRPSWGRAGAGRARAGGVCCRMHVTAAAANRRRRARSAPRAQLLSRP